MPLALQQTGVTPQNWLEPVECGVVLLLPWIALMINMARAFSLSGYPHCMEVSILILHGKAVAMEGLRLIDSCGVGEFDACYMLDAGVRYVHEQAV